MKKLSSVCVALATAVAASVYAEEFPPNAVIVTATRTAQTVDETLAAVTVFNREDIERSQAKNVAELLNGSAGVLFSELGGPGKTSEIYLRGTNKEHVVVLVDGVRIGSATLGDAAWQHIPLAQVDRIEIVRGPNSSLYGADAIGGVVQIFTREGTSRLRAGVEAGYGTHDSREYTANISGAQGGFHYSAAADLYETDGINSRTLATAAHDPDNDGYYNRSFSSRVGYRFGKRAEISAHMMHARGRAYYDSSTTGATGTNEGDYEQSAQGAELRVMPSSFWDMKINVGRSRDDSDNFKNRVFVNTIDTLRRTQSWQNDFTFAARQLFTVGIDHQTDLVQNINNVGLNQFSIAERDNTGYFVQHQAGFGASDLRLSLRRDDNDAFGVNDTGNVAWGQALDGEKIRLIVSYGTAFRAPTFNQLYFPNFGNPDVKPEESESYELALRGKQSKSKWDVRAFQTNVDNLIVNVGSPLRPQNVNKARIRGLETEASTRIDNTRLLVNLTLLDPRDVQTNLLLPRRSKQSIRLDAEVDVWRIKLGGEWLVRSYSYDNVNNTVRLGGYGLVNLRAQYDFAKDWFLRGRVGNLLDKEYETADTYNTLGRNYFLTLGYQMNSKSNP